MTYNAQVAAAKTAQERKQKRAHQKHMADVRLHGKPVKRIHLKEPPYAKIKRSGSLDVYEETAADEILAAYHMAMGVALQDQEPDRPRLPTRPDTADHIAAHTSDLVRAFQTWRTGLEDTLPLRIVKAVMFAETSLQDIDAAFHWRSGTAKIHFVAGIRHFAVLRAPRGTHPHHWTFTKETTP